MFIVLIFLPFNSCSNFQVDLNEFFQDSIAEGKKEILDSIIKKSDIQSRTSVTDFEFEFRTREFDFVKSTEIENYIFNKNDYIMLSKIYLHKDENLSKINPEQACICLYKEDLLLEEAENCIQLKKHIKNSGEKITLVVNFTYLDLNLEAKFIIKT